MLQNLGWKPGTSLGPKNKNSNGLKAPLMAVKRPNKLGLGFNLGSKGSFEFSSMQNSSGQNNLSINLFEKSSDSQ